MGQEHIKEALLAQLEKGKISHAYLFSGPRGTGKTSTARIFAKAVNCLNHKKTDKFGEPCNACNICTSITDGSHLDLIEIDAASNRGIDEIRELREKIKLSPTQARYKVYIIDEAHMLTHDAFNALLKTLEEPPPHAIFILATTEPQKVPPTVASRTTRFDFKMPDAEQIKKKISLITKQEKWGLAPDALDEIALAASGAFRDAEVLLEKVASVDSSATREKTQEILGKKQLGDTINLLELIEAGKGKEALVWLDDYLKSGGNVRVLTEGVLEVLRKTLLTKVGASEVIMPITKEEEEKLVAFSKSLTKNRLMELADLFNKAIENLRESTIPQLPLEMAIVEATLDSSEETEEVGAVVKTEVTELIEESPKKEPQQRTETKNETISQKPETKGNGKAKPVDIKKAGGGDKLLEKLQKNWDKVLKETKAANSSLVHFLKEAKPVDIDEDLRKNTEKSLN
jgi:DNA polymerase-3 subunit gamma/tau